MRLDDTTKLFDLVVAFYPIESFAGAFGPKRLADKLSCEQARAGQLPSEYRQLVHDFRKLTTKNRVRAARRYLDVCR